MLNRRYNYAGNYETASRNPGRGEVGLHFRGHPDLRRIQMWEGYPYFPLRKEFPLEGKSSEMPDVAFTSIAPMEGEPFVTQPSTATTKNREPRSRRPELE